MPQMTTFRTPIRLHRVCPCISCDHRVSMLFHVGPIIQVEARAVPVVLKKHAENAPCSSPQQQVQ
jgi:hypothetical protein